MHTAQLILIVIYCSIQSSLCGPFSIGGKCVDSPTVSTFDMRKVTKKRNINLNYYSFQLEFNFLTQFQGIWYESMRFPNVYEGDDDDTTCIQYNFTTTNNTAMVFNATAYKT